MPTYVAFLRAINVTGRFLRMELLASAFRTLGHEDARTYISSGNVVFSSSLRSPEGIARTLEKELAPLLGFRSEVFLRSAAEVKAIAEQGAALRSRMSAEGDVNVFFLPEVPSVVQTRAILTLRSATDDFEILGKEVYWLPRKQSDSKFSNAALERRLRTRSTLRKVSMLTGLASKL